MDAIVAFDPAKLAVALGRVAREAAPSLSFLRMDKAGNWSFGIEADPVEDEQEFFINPTGFRHGWVCWGDAEKLGEALVPVTEALPETGPVPGGGRGWEFQLACHFKDVQSGQELVYASSSVGGKRAIAGVAAEIGARCAAGEEKNVPVVTLGSSDYKHKKYGKIYNPIFDVRRWVAIDTVGDKPAKPAKLPGKRK